MRVASERRGPTEAVDDRSVLVGLIVVIVVLHLICFVPCVWRRPAGRRLVPALHLTCTFVQTAKLLIRCVPWSTVTDALSRRYKAGYTEFLRDCHRCLPSADLV